MYSYIKFVFTYQGMWDGCSDDDIVTDFDDINEVNSAPHLADKNNIYHISLMFIMLWASLYGISATALNDLVQLLHQQLRPSLLYFLNPYT